jgi:hypothetical protein
VSRSGIFEFDLSTVNPSGFSAAVVDHGVARLSYDGDAWSIVDQYAEVGSIGSQGAFDPATLPELRRYQALQIDWASHPGDEAALRWIAAAAAAGVPLFSLGAAPAWAAPLGDELLRRLDVQAEDLADPLQRELHSVRQRRAALAARHRETNGSLPTVTAMICTCRPEFVGSALDAMKRQHYPNLEVVLLLHGIGRDQPEVRKALDETDLSVTVRQVSADTVFGDALNLGVEAASGEYVTKIDDDDWYGPNHVGDLVNAIAYSEADVVGSFTEFVHLEHLDLTIYRPAGGGEKYTKFVAGGTITAKRQTLRDLGGFPPVPKGIDVGLFERVKQADGRIYRNHGMEYVLSRRMIGHTWDVEVGYFLKSSELQWFKTPLAEHVASDSLESCLTRKKGLR